MTTITFDTHQFVLRLKNAGMEERQAEAIVEAFQSAHGEAEVATKQDLREMELRQEIKLAEMQVRLAEVKSELIRWVVGAGFLQTALIAALLLKLVK